MDDGTVDGWSSSNDRWCSMPHQTVCWEWRSTPSTRSTSPEKIQKVTRQISSHFGQGDHYPSRREAEELAGRPQWPCPGIQESLGLEEPSSDHFMPASRPSINDFRAGFDGLASSITFRRAYYQIENSQSKPETMLVLDIGTLAREA